MKTFLISAFLIFVGPIGYAVTIGDDGLHKPTWLQITFKDMHEDLADASAENKRFFVIFEQRGCIYCKEMHEKVLSDPSVLKLLNDKFFAVQMNLFGDEEVIDFNGAKVIIAPLAQMFLFGTTIDYEDGILESGFKFNNPNVTESCGCGESIKF